MFLSPKRLRYGSRVAIVAPASPFFGDELLAGMDILREVGLRPVYGENVKNLRSIACEAAPIADRARELMWAFTDPSIDGVIAACGGYGSAELLPHLDYKKIRAFRKPFIGMSDNTALNNGILARAGLISINGQSPNIRLTEGKRVFDADTESFRFALEMMMSEDVWGTLPFDKMNKLFPRTISPGITTGHIIGGNLDTFRCLAGSDWCPPLDNAILFVEDVHQGGQRIAREFLQMELSGDMAKLAGVVVGEFIDVPQKTDSREPSIEMVLQRFLTRGCPTTVGYSFSHGDWTIPVPIGARCEVDADNGVIFFDFKMD